MNTFPTPRSGRESNEQVTGLRLAFESAAKSEAEHTETGPERQLSMRRSTSDPFARLARSGRALSMAVFGLLAAAVLAGSLMAPFGGKAAAQDKPGQEAVFGTVFEVTPPDAISVVTDAGTVKLIIGLDTQLNSANAAIKVDQVAVGDRLVATATRRDDGSFLGVRVLIPQGDASKPVNRHITGVVVDIAEGQVTVLDRDGNKITIYVPQGVELPAVGDAIATVAALDPKTQRFLAKAFEKVQKVVERIEDAAAKAADADKAQRLKELAQEARTRHLSAIEEARRGLEKARGQVAEAADQARKAGERLKELEENLGRLNQQYKDEAQKRGEESPRARVKGTWAGADAQTFTVRTNEGELKFAYDDRTQVLGVAVNEEGVQVVITGPGDDRAVPPALREVVAKLLVGAALQVEYQTGAAPQLALKLIFVKPELPKAVRDAIDVREKGIFTGTITLVETAKEPDGTVGLVIVADDESGRKAVAGVTKTTEISVDGQPAGFDQLAAGQQAEVRFDEAVIHAAAGASAAASKGLLDAISIRARTRVGEEERHIAGIIREIAPNERVLVITPKDGENIKVHVDDDARILKNGAPAKFADLRPGDLVLDATRYNRLTHEIVRLVVHSPRNMDFAGVISGIEAARIELPTATADRPGVVEGLKVTVNQRNGEQVTFLVTRETKLASRTRGSIKPSDLAVGDTVAEGQLTTVQVGGQGYNLAVAMVIGSADIETIRGVAARVDAALGALVVEVPGKDRRVELHVPTPSSKASMFKNERPIDSLRLVEAGDIVENATYETKDNTILKLSVVSPNVARVSGTVARLDAAAGVLVIGSRDAAGKTAELRVNSGTKIHVNGREAENLRNVAIGDTANALYLYEGNDKTRGVALVLQFFSLSKAGEARPAQPGAATAKPAAVETTVAGKIEVIEGDTWVISARKFLVNDKTQFFGEKPEVGLVAKAALRAAESGVFTAVVISVAGRPDDKPAKGPVDIKPVDPASIGRPDVQGTAFRISGVIEAVDGRTVLLAGVKFQITGDTKVSGTAEAGREARAVLFKRSDGSVVALEVQIGDKKDIKPAQKPVRPTPKPAVTPTPAGELRFVPSPLAAAS